MKSTMRGFTLVEVLLAVLIGSLVLTSIYGVFTSVSGAANRLQQEGEIYHQVRIFYDRIGGELRSMRVQPVNQQTAFANGTTLEGEPFIEFNTELVSPLLADDGGGVSRVRYELRRDEDGGAAIYRSEQLLLTDLAASEALPFIDQVKSFELRYYQQGEWHERWSGTSPPSMLEISLEIENEEQTIPFRSSFALPGGNG